MASPLPLNPFALIEYPDLNGGATGVSFKDTTGRIVDSSDPGGRTLTLMIGPAQSNAANSLNGAYTPASPNVRQINIFDGKMYRMQDPMLGVTGTVGGWPSEVGQKLIDAGYGRVVFINCAVGGTAISDWSPGPSTYGTVLLGGMFQPSRGCFFHRLAVGLLWARTFGLVPDAALVMIGETDASYNTLQSQWVADALDCFGGMADFGFSGKIIIAQETASGAFPAGAGAVRAAQAALVDPSKGRYAGPDCDTVTDRYDGVHLNVPGGRESVATLWANTIMSLFP